MTTSHVLMLVVVAIMVHNIEGGRVTRVGNEIKEGNAGADFQRTAFLLHNTALADGILFAFSAYFRNMNAVFFQLWRPIPGSPNNHTLVKEWRFVPAISGGKEDLYIHSRPGLKCVRVQRADRLGLYFGIGKGSVSYTFDSSATESLRYVVTNNTNKPTEGDKYQFDTLAYPYRFSAAAYIDSDISRYNLSAPIECPQTLQIPATLPSTGVSAMAATGATGPQGIPGATGPAGAIGPKGNKGSIGIMGQPGSPGPIGQTGPKGENGLPGKDGKDGKDGKGGKVGLVGPRGEKGEVNTVKAASSIDSMLASCLWCKGLLNPYLILGLILWLTVVTIAIIVLTCCFISRRKYQKNVYAQNLKYAGSQNDLWKNYAPNNNKQETAKVPSYENGGMEETYDSIEEGRTAF